MDPTFMALLAELRGKGFTDRMFSWLAVDNAQEWERRVRRIEGWLTTATPDQVARFGQAETWEAAEAFMGGASQTPGDPSLQPPHLGGPGGGQPPSNQPSQGDSAFQMIRRLLDEHNLGGLAEWAWRRYQEGASIDLIMNELYQRPEFKTAYPEYHELAKKGRAMSVAEIQANRRQYVQLMHMYGIPQGFYDSTDDLARFLINEVSPAELSKRLASAAEATYQSSPLMRAEMERLYGVSQGDLIAYWLDPTVAEPIIRQKWVSSQIGAASRQSGYGLLSQDEAARLYGQGVDYAAANRGFGELARSQELFGSLNAAEEQIGRDTQLGAAFGGDAMAQEQVERRRSRRLAEFQGGGSFATNREGIAGVA